MMEKRYIEEVKLEERFGRENHWKVPEGYFHVMAEEVMAKLPEQKDVPRFVEMTRWQKIKPYVYLAAMFCGIWLMMNVFGRVAGSSSVNLDNPPERIAMLMEMPEVHEIDYVMPTSVMSDIAIEEEVSDSYDSMAEFEDAFEEAGTEDDEQAMDN